MKYGCWCHSCHNEDDDEGNARPCGYLGFGLREEMRREFQNEAIGGGNHMSC